MCGLVGIAGNITVAGERAFKRMLELDTIRGPHSTGIFSVKSDKSTMLLKQVGTPWDMYDNKQSDVLFRSISKVLLGHNRWATKGKVNKANAHPFEFDTLAGAHNGTLNTCHQLDDHEKFAVDSENLYYHMDRNGVEDTIKKLDGAFALTWYNKQDNTINFIRNNERTLFYAFTEDKKALLWASEAWMMEVACRYAEIKLGEIQPLPVGFLHTFDVPTKFDEVFSKGRVRRLDMYTRPVYVNNFNNLYGTQQTTTTSTNVVPLNGKAGAFKVKKPFSEYQKWVGKSVLFYVGCEGTSSGGQRFIQCWNSEDEDISIRVFASQDSHDWKRLMASSNYFRGTAKSYTAIDNGYLTIDLRTLEEVVVADTSDTPPEFFLGFENEVLSEVEFDKRTKKGCAWCSSPVFIRDAEDITWIARDEFICCDCSEQPEVKKYLLNS